MNGSRPVNGAEEGPGATGTAGRRPTARWWTVSLTVLAVVSVAMVALGGSGAGSTARAAGFLPVSALSSALLTAGDLGNLYQITSITTSTTPNETLPTNGYLSQVGMSGYQAQADEVLQGPSPVGSSLVLTISLVDFRSANQAMAFLTYAATVTPNLLTSPTPPLVGDAQALISSSSPANGPADALLFAVIGNVVIRAEVSTTTGAPRVDVAIRAATLQEGRVEAAMAAALAPTASASPPPATAVPVTRPATPTVLPTPTPVPDEDPPQAEL